MFVSKGYINKKNRSLYPWDERYIYLHGMGDFYGIYVRPMDCMGTGIRSWCIFGEISVGNLFPIPQNLGLTFGRCYEAPG